MDATNCTGHKSTSNFPHQATLAGEVARNFAIMKFSLFAHIGWAPVLTLMPSLWKNLPSQSVLDVECCVNDGVGGGGS